MSFKTVYRHDVEKFIMENEDFARDLGKYLEIESYGEDSIESVVIDAVKRMKYERKMKYHQEQISRLEKELIK